MEICRKRGQEESKPPPGFVFLTFFFVLFGRRVSDYFFRVLDMEFWFVLYSLRFNFDLGEATSPPSEPELGELIDCYMPV